MSGYTAIGMAWGLALAMVLPFEYGFSVWLERKRMAREARERIDAHYRKSGYARTAHGSALKNA